ncbi:hypothetical protein [uncultured Clostridium sp.]|uniref:hypothetical protein n=1 Tax=uncultured Clostridium sp. TaxID=59620 RepID=UPI0026178508|nr:hypothetical protein [uncultured Clostridium sp.]
MNKFESIKALVADLETDANKFYGAGNSAAGSRLRKGLQSIKFLAQEARNEITDLKNKK